MSQVAYYHKSTELRDDVTLVRIPGADHFQLIDPASVAWGLIMDALEAVVAPSPCDNRTGNAH